ncbi:hypothetical protein BT96DRAFT_984615 [Gymnopus androsaceus JB14]|uniref:3-beta hydroxysteroid dehydrogenase/isomerase domain-containing protein n=1 Tax=Gymnopus androsaceus JB14 TaxID=1447944 RepID=A0A6A4IIQ6_9AGAR|nr:hypothetical protein BT96DRAFT_984615 [Gymnopus androsaceus JB14]
MLSEMLVHSKCVLQTISLSKDLPSNVMESFLREVVISEEPIIHSGATCIIHIISPLSIRNRDNLQIFHEVNVEGTKKVIQASNAAGVGKLVYHSSSGTVFDWNDIGSSEQFVLEANGNHGLETASIRPAGIFGIGDQETIVGTYGSWKQNTTNSIEVAGQSLFITNNDPRPFWDFMRALWSGFDRIFPDHPRILKRQVVIPRMFTFFLAYVMATVGWLKNQQEQTLMPYTVTFATATMYFSSEKAKKTLGYAPVWS